MLPQLDRKNLLELCRRMILIRHFEERLIGQHDAGEFSGHYHVYIGQEATGVAAISCLEAGDRAGGGVRLGEPVSRARIGAREYLRLIFFTGEPCGS